MYYFDPHEIISSLVMPLMEASKRTRDYIVEMSLDDAPVRLVRWLSMPSNLYAGTLFMRGSIRWAGTGTIGRT